MEDYKFRLEHLMECFDNIIRKCRKEEREVTDQKELKHLVFECLVGPSGESDAASAEQRALAFFDGFKDVDNKKQMAVSLLRLIAEPHLEWLTDKPWRPKIVALFDSQFMDDLYVDRKIDTKLLSHQKLERLIDIVRDYENRLSNALNMLTSLERMNAHRQKLMSVINSKIGRVLTHPFLPHNIEASLGEIYKRVETYLSRREGQGIVDAFMNANEEINQFIENLQSKESLYSMWLAKKVGEKLLELLKADFQSNKAVQSGNLVLETIDKKYPFHFIGEVINLGFRVTNQGPGYTYDTKIEVACDDNVELFEEEIGLGRLAPEKTQLVEIPCRVLRFQREVELYLSINWKDFDGTSYSHDFEFQALAQRENIDWDMLSKSDPYSLEPVSGEQDLVGRKDLLNRLIGTSMAPSVGSSIIQGQKRVGKTSIAKALLSHLIRHDYIVVYIEAGDYVEPSGRSTITRLGNRLCREIKHQEPKVAHVTSPSFEEALSPLVEFLDEVAEIIPDKRIVFILDEFDQLPLELYTKGPLGNAFFLTLRSITSRSNIGFVLVGGERMAHIMDCQGDQLNKWSVISVDYFSRESDWTDFTELVKRPTAGNLEFTSEALSSLYDVTAGNPYFTKLICRSVLDLAVRRRDCYITGREINDGVKEAVEHAERNTFQHFWEDGILEADSKGREKSIRRRRILIALSDVLRKERPASEKSIQEHPILRDVVTAQTELKEFVSRKVLVSNEQGKFEFKVPLLQLWLKGKGVDDIISTFSDLDIALRERQSEEELKIGSQEIVELIKKWGNYKGQAITEDNIRAWLEQFGNVKDQRAMFKILKGLKYYSSSFVREKMREVDAIVRKSIIWKVDKRKVKRSDILVSYMDGPAKSGAHFARLYADEAKIYVDNVVEKGKIAEVLEIRPEAQALVFVDDFVGTGQSAVKYLGDLAHLICEVTENRGLRVFFVVVVAYVEGWKHLEQTLEKLSLPVEAHACEILEETAKCFNERSDVLSDPTEREFAKKVALTYGKQIVRKNPLGYGDLELAVIFERGCPNNSLPILWSESATPKWTPIFKRD